MDTDRTETNAHSLLTKTLAGDATAREALWDSVYGELHAIAARLNWGRGGRTLQTTAIVNEAYIKLVGHDVEGRSQLVALAAKAMRQVMIDYARAKATDKRGGGRGRVPLIDSAIMGAGRPIDVLELEDALERLESREQRAANVVVLRFYGGLTNDQIADLHDVSEKTVRNDWRHAKAWLRSELRLQ